MQLVETLVVYQKIYDQLIKIVLLKWKRRGLYHSGSHDKLWMALSQQHTW